MTDEEFDIEEEDEDEDMSEEEMQRCLHSLLRDEFARVVTYDECGMMTYNKGVVIETDEGVEFQLTIIRSK